MTRRTYARLEVWCCALAALALVGAPLAVRLTDALALALVLVCVVLLAISAYCGTRATGG